MVRDRFYKHDWATLFTHIFSIAELPTARATRSLTLVAKTLQTLANFTRFQGKENFMEFLNDFLEEEAPRMNEFLHQISTKSDQPVSDNILSWSGYIDQGKQLSILHHLLAESIQKLPPNRQTELSSLRNILDAITRAKATNGSLTSMLSISPQPLIQGSNNSINNSNNQETIYQANSINLIGGGERGIMRGVLTPSSLERNIFRYNDPTVSVLVNNLQSSSDITPSQSQSSLNNTNYPNGPHQPQYTSNTSLVSNNNYHNYLDSANAQNQPPNQIINSQFVHPAQSKASFKQHQAQHAHPYHLQNPILQQKTINYSTDSLPSTPRNFNTLSNYHVSSSTAHVGSRKAAVARASTLPRNNNTIVNINRENEFASPEQPASSSSTNYIQIGVDTSSAFVRKSPTPMYKSSQSSGSGVPRDGLLDSQPSSTSVRHNEDTTSYLPNRDLTPQFNNIRQYLNQQPTRTTNAHSNMPMKIEDLDDLLNYADEQAAAAVCDARITSSDHSGSYPNVAIMTISSAGDELLNKNNNNINNNKQLHCSIIQYLNDKYSDNAIGNHNNNNGSNISNISSNHSNLNGNYNIDNSISNKYVNSVNSSNVSGASNQPPAYKNSIPLQQPVASANLFKNTTNTNIKANDVFYKDLKPNSARSSHKTASLSSSSSDDGVIGHNLNLMCCGVSGANHRLGQSNHNNNNNGHNNLNGTLSSSSHGSTSEKEHHSYGSGGGVNDYNNILVNIGKSTKRLEEIPLQTNRTNSVLQVRLQRYQ